MTIRAYEVGGSIRNRQIGFPINDIDIAVEADSYKVMEQWIESIVKKVERDIFVRNPEYVTIKARVGNMVCDFVLCRQDGYYSDNRRPDRVIPGTLFDDLARRDFTMNAIAKRISLPGAEADANESLYIDPYEGFSDIDQRLIRCVGNTYERIIEDYLRLLRAVRFCITLGFRIDPEIENLLTDYRVMTGLKTKISRDRVREEIRKAFVCDTVRAMSLFGRYPLLTWACFDDRKVWLTPTMAER